MANYTITTDETREAILAWLSAKGSVENRVQLQALCDQKLDEYAVMYRDDPTSVQSKLAEYETMKPTADKIAALKTKEAALVQKLIDGELTAADVTVAVQAPGNEEPLEG